MLLAESIPEKDEIEYKHIYKGKAEGIDLKAGVRREGSTFQFYLSGDIHSKKINVKVDEAYGNSLHAQFIAPRLNKGVLEASGYVLDSVELRSNVQELLNNMHI